MKTSHLDGTNPKTVGEVGPHFLLLSFFYRGWSFQKVLSGGVESDSIAKGSLPPAGIPAFVAFPSIVLLSGFLLSVMVHCAAKAMSSPFVPLF